jgi:hypothetical protein
MASRTNISFPSASSPQTLTRLLPAETMRTYEAIARKISDLSLSPESFILSLKNRSSEELYSFLLRFKCDQRACDQISTLKNLFSQRQALIKAALVNSRSSDPQAAITLFSTLQAEDSDWMASRVTQLQQERISLIKGVRYLRTTTKPITYRKQTVYRSMVPDALFHIALGFSRGNSWVKPSSYIQIGGGGFGKVYTIIGPDEETYVLKYFPNSTDATKEAFILSQLSKGIGLIELVDSKKMALEYAPNGDLYKYTQKVQKAFPLRRERYMFLKLLVREALEAVDELHNEARYVHKDIKPGNLLLDRNMKVRLSDLNLAQPIGEKMEDCGTGEYLAPETWDPSAVATPAVDVWSFGIMLCEMFTGLLPCKAHGSKSNHAFVAECRRRNYTAVPVADLFRHSTSSPFCAEDFDVINMITKMLTFNPKNRSTVEQILQHPFFMPQSSPLANRISSSCTPNPNTSSSSTTHTAQSSNQTPTLVVSSSALSSAIASATPTTFPRA